MGQEAPPALALVARESVLALRLAIRPALQAPLSQTAQADALLNATG